MKFKKSLACMLAVLMVTTSSPLNTGSINVYAAGTSVSTAAPANKGGSFKDKICGFFKKHKKTFIAAALTAAAITAGYFIRKKYKENKLLRPVDNGANPGNGNNANGGNGGNGDNGNNDNGGNNANDNDNGNGNDNGNDNGNGNGGNGGAWDQQFARGERWVNKGKDHFAGLPVVGTAIAGSAAVLFVVNQIGTLSETLSKLGKNMANIINPYGFFGQIYENFKRKLNEKFNPTIPITPETSNKNLELLFKDFKGQEKAKEQIRTAVNQIVVNKDRARRKNEPYSHGDILYFIGPSGVGKSFAAAGLANYQILGNNGFYLMSSSDVDLSNKKQSVVEQIFGPKAADFGYDLGNGNVKRRSSLFSYIQNNPNGIVIIDEYDLIADKALDEVMRGITDKGTVIVYGEELDCSGITFILTSNETKSSLNLSNDQEADGALREHEHDKSFTNRIHVVEFENLPIETFKEITRSQFIPLLRDYFANEDCGNINLILDDNTVDALAKKTRDYGKGARHLLNDLSGEATAVITNFLAGKNYEDFKHANGRDVTLKYILEDVNEKEKKSAEEDREGKNYKLVNGAYKYKLDDIDPEEIELAKQDKDFKRYVKTNKEYKKYRLLDLSAEEEKVAKEYIDSKADEKLYVKLQGHKKRKLENISRKEKELILKDKNYLLQNQGLYVKIGGEYKKYKLLDISSEEERLAKKDRAGLYVKVGDKYKKYDLENITSDEEEDINAETENDLYVKTDVYKKYDLQEIKPEEEVLARKDTSNKFYVIKDPVYKKYVFKAEFK